MGELPLITIRKKTLAIRTKVEALYTHSMKSEYLGNSEAFEKTLV